MRKSQKIRVRSFAAFLAEHSYKMILAHAGYLRPVAVKDAVVYVAVHHADRFVKKIDSASAEQRYQLHSHACR